MLKSGNSYSGSSGKANKEWPFNIIFENYDEVSKTFTGKIKYKLLKVVTKIEGSFDGESLIFKEVSFIKKGRGVALNTTYKLDKLKKDKLSGLWDSRAGQWAWINIK